GRRALHREPPQPSAGQLERQAVKTSSLGGARGEDGAKQLGGHKRPRRGDPDGRLRAVRVVHPATSRDREGIKRVRDEPTRARLPHLPRLQQRWLASSSNGRGGRGGAGASPWWWARA